MVLRLPLPYLHCVSSAYANLMTRGRHMGKAAKPTRENCTITADFQREATYSQLLGNGKAFFKCVLAFVLSMVCKLKHSASGGCLTHHSHYVHSIGKCIFSH
jgi:hypothetical protein